MKLDYRIAPDWEKSGLDLEAADATYLRYRAVPGDILLTSGEVDLSARWGWIPLLDFALALNEIARKLTRDGAVEAFEFTESDAKLTFSRKGKTVTISASYAPGEFKVSPAVLKMKIHEFASRLGREAVEKYSGLGRNRIFKKWEIFA